MTTQEEQADTASARELVLHRTANRRRPGAAAVSLVFQALAGLSLREKVFLGGGLLFALWSFFDRASDLSQLLQSIGIPIWIFGVIILSVIGTIAAMRYGDALSDLLEPEVVAAIQSSLGERLQTVASKVDELLAERKSKGATKDPTVDIYLTAPIDDLKPKQLRRYREHFSGIFDSLLWAGVDKGREPENFVLPRLALLNEDTTEKGGDLNPATAYEVSVSALARSRRLVVIWPDDIASSVPFELGIASALNIPTAIFYLQPKDFPLLLRGRLEKHTSGRKDAADKWPVAFHSVKDLSRVQGRIEELAATGALFPDS